MSLINLDEWILDLSAVREWIRNENTIIGHDSEKLRNGNFCAKFSIWIKTAPTIYTSQPPGFLELFHNGDKLHVFCYCVREANALVWMGRGCGCEEQQKWVRAGKWSKLIWCKEDAWSGWEREAERGEEMALRACAFARPLSTAPDNDTLFSLFFLLGSGSRACRHGNSSHPALASLPELEACTRTHWQSENLCGPVSTRGSHPYIRFIFIFIVMTPRLIGIIASVESRVTAGTNFYTRSN